MASGAYTTSVRQSLRDKGIQDSDITYDPNSNAVKVRGQTFMNPTKNISGTTFDTQTNFDNAWRSYNQQNQPQQQQQQQPAYSQYGGNNPYNDPYKQQLQTVVNAYNTPKPVDVNQIYASPEYAAIQAQQQRNTQRGIRSAQESMGASGFGRSTQLSDRAQGIQNDANAYLQTQILPQLMSQARAAQQQGIDNQAKALGLYGNERTYHDSRYDQGQKQAIQQAELTGYYNNPDAPNIERQMGMNSAAYASASPDEKVRLHNDNLRLAALIGGRDTTGQGDYEFAPQRTMEGQKYDYGIQKDARDLAYKAEQDYIQNQLEREKIDNQVRQFAQRLGFDYEKMDTDTKNDLARIAISQQNANTSSSRAATSSSKSATKAAEEAASGGPKVSTTQFNNAFKTLQQKYGVARYKETKDAKGKTVYDESAPPTYANTTNPDQQAKLVVDVLSLGLNDDQTLQMWNKLGITEELAQELLGEG